MAQVTEKPRTAAPAGPITREELEMTAYFHWLDRGCPFDDPITDWIEAEKKLGRATRPEGSQKKS